mgnify:CR=1 FL=1
MKLFKEALRVLKNKETTIENILKIGNYGILVIINSYR